MGSILCQNEDVRHVTVAKNMFESEDFDLDDDFLNDIDKKEEEYYSQKIEKENDQSNKRRKIEPIQSDCFNDIIFDEEPDIAEITKKSVEPNIHESVHDSRHNFIPEISNSKALSPSKNAYKNSDICQKSGKKTETLSKSVSNKHIELKRKTLALNILRKGIGSRDSRTQNNFNPTALKLLLRQTCSDGERNPRIDDFNEESRGNGLSEIFKKPQSKVPRLPVEFAQRGNFLSRDRAASRVTLVRKFPGPAGLLPDSHDSDLESVNFLHRSSDWKNEEIEDHDDSGISEYFSQDTERMFSGGAWRLMLDDLPLDFLKGHEIATFKRTARNNSRVSILAGVIQRIDHSVENPRLVLKDLSDTIEGTMHRDVTLAHPNILEPGVVVLLRNAGVLGFQASPNFPSLQFHVMIGLRNVAAIYSEKSRLVTSTWMESLLGNVDESRRIVTKNPAYFTDCLDDEMNYTNIFTNNFEFDEDNLEFVHFRKNETNDSLVKSSLSKFPSKINNWMDMSSPKDDAITERGTQEIVVTRCSSAKEIKENLSEPSISMNVDLRPKKIESVRLKLAQFKSKDALTPEIKEKTDKTVSSSEINVSKSKGFADYLLDSDNDTEDEILSQLDVDSIVTSYNSAA